MRREGGACDIAEAKEGARGAWKQLIKTANIN